MIKKLTIALAGAVTATALLLTGCGGSGQGGAGAPAEQPTGSAAAPSTPGGDSSTPATESSTPSEESSKDSGSDSGGKPSKDEIVTGLTKFYQETQGQPADKAKKFAVCMVDEMYDKAKPATLKAMRDGQPAKADSGDAGLFAEAGMACAKHLS